jgi:hypothetical protein
MIRLARITLLSAQAFVAITALAGGLALIVGSLDPDRVPVIVPPREYLAGSPFSSYLVPGMSLIVLVAGVHAAAFVTTIARSRWAMPLAAAGGFACLIWIFIQMIYIPFSVLQALYFAVGLIELGVTMLLLGILTRPANPHRSTYVPAHAGVTPDVGD